MFPENDTEYEEVKIKTVDDHGEYWSVEREDGWSLSFEKEYKVVPVVGATLRIYGKGIGYAFRGLFVDGQKVFYRTDAEQKVHQDNELYGADAAEWLKRWDNGSTVWSIEMGGLGPGYEQCIQVTVAEILRHCLDKKYKLPADDKAQWKKDIEAIEAWSHKDERIGKLGLSGAQWGAACNLAINLYRDGPINIMHDARVKDRKIQVNRNFPDVYSEAAQ